MHEPGFFLVWNPDAGPPQKRHALRESAVEEALRLARQNPGQRFYVLAVIGYARKTDVEWVVLEHNDAPFYGM